MLATDNIAETREQETGKHAREQETGNRKPGNILSFLNPRAGNRKQETGNRETREQETMTGNRKPETGKPASRKQETGNRETVTAPAHSGNRARSQNRKQETMLASRKPANGVQVEFPSLMVVETGLQWVENLIHVLTPRLLVLGFVLSMVDLLTNGGLLHSAFMIYMWAFIQALAIDASLPNLWRLAFTRFDERRYASGIILLVIGIGLGLVVFAALAIQFLQQADNITLEQAMRKLDVSPEIITYVRSISVVFLAAVLSVLNRSKVTASRKQETVTTSSNREQETGNKETREQETITGNKETVTAPAHSGNRETREQEAETLPVTGKLETGNILALMKHEETREQETGNHAREQETKQGRIQAILLATPDMEVTQLAASAGVSKGYASKQKARFLQMQEQAQEVTV